jgi:DNA-binding transcriptional MerR regulator
MRIGEAAAAVGVTTRTLRYYEERGLLTAERTDTGQREYTELHLERLRMARALLKSGLTIEDVHHLFSLHGEGQCGVLRAVVEHRLADLDDRIQRLLDVRQRLATRYAEQFAGVLM